jgi:hypothetical protein
MKKGIITAVSLVVLAGGLISASPVFAADQSAHDTLVTRIADKFKLNKADVQAVFDEFRTERRAARETRYAEYLSKLVSNGKITEEQKTLLVAKHKELAEYSLSQRNNWKDMSSTDRKEHIDAKIKELKAWADQNHIDIKYLLHASGNHMFRRGMHRMK